MSALRYLYFTILKNRIRAFFQKPANWIVLLLAGALLGTVIFTGGRNLPSPRPIQELYAMLSLLYAAVFVLIAYHGVNRGVTLFSLADIHLIFPSPLQPKKILMYGLVKQMGTSLTVGLFLLFQYGWVHQSYGVPITFLLLALLGYGLSLFLGQLTAMVLYSITHGNEGKRKAAKVSLLALCGLGALYVLIPVFRDSSNWLLVGAERLSRLPMLIFPAGGWIRSLVEGIWAGDLAMSLLSLLATALFTAAGVRYLGRDETDYYEDVLKATETLHQSLTARREGKTSEILPEHIKVGLTGLKGQGAAVFYYKHRLESRRGRRFLLDTLTTVMLLASLAFAYLMRGHGVLPGLAFATYMQLFSISQGRWVKELSRPYIYLVPEKAILKLYHCLRESVMTYAAEAVLLMVPMGLIFGLSVWEIVALVLVRVSFSLLFVAGNLMMDKLFSSLMVKALTVMVYFLIMAVLAAPGIVLSAFVYASGIAAISAAFTSLCAMALANFLLVPPLLFFARNIMNDPEWLK